METKRIKKRSFGKFLKKTLPTFALITMVVCALVIPSGAVNAYKGLTYDKEAQRVLTPFTLYGDLEYYNNTPWSYGVDYTTCTDPTMYYDLGMGAYNQVVKTDNRGDGTNEAEEYTITIMQGVYPSFEPIYNVEGGQVATAYAYNNIWSQDGRLIAGGADDSGYYADLTKKITAVGGGYFVSWDMFNDDVISKIHLVPYERIEVMNAQGLDYATAFYEITYVMKGGKTVTWTYEMAVDRVYCDSNIVNQAVNNGSRTPWYGYQYVASPDSTSPSFQTCEIPIIPDAFQDEALLYSAGEQVYILNASVEVQGFSKNDYESDPAEAIEYPLAPICEIYGNPYYGDNDYRNWYVQPWETYFTEIGFEAYNIGYDDGYSVGYSNGYSEGEAVNMEDWTLSNFLVTAISGFLEVELFGFFSIGGLLAFAVAIGLVVVFLKFFAGG